MTARPSLVGVFFEVLSSESSAAPLFFGNASNIMIGRFLPSVAALLLAQAFVRGDSHEDRMESLPGYPHPLPSPWYSGFLDYELNGVNVHTHYVYVEAEQDENETPLIYWSNGGPVSVVCCFSWPFEICARVSNRYDSHINHRARPPCLA